MASSPVPSPESNVRRTARLLVVLGLASGLVLVLPATYAVARVAMGLDMEMATVVVIVVAAFGVKLSQRVTLPELTLAVVFGAMSGIVGTACGLVLPAVFRHISDGAAGPTPLLLMIVPLVGTVFGAASVIPLRRFYLVDMAKDLPFPEAEALSRTLQSARRRIRDALVLWVGGGIGLLSGAASSLLGLWPTEYKSRTAQELVVLEASPAMLGLGFLMGAKLAVPALIASLVWSFVLPLALPRSTAWSPAEVARQVGVGAMVAWSILALFTAALKTITQVSGTKPPMSGGEAQGDLPLATVVCLALAATLAFAAVLVPVLDERADSVLVAGVLAVLSLSCSVVLAQVAAWVNGATGLIPATGLTVSVLLLFSLLLPWDGGASGRLAVLLVGTAVCAAVVTAGNLLTLLKVGTTIGVPCRRVEWAAILASLPMCVIGYFTVQWFGLGTRVEAPLATALNEVLKLTWDQQRASLIMNFVGAGIVLLASAARVSPLGLALGLFLGLDKTLPLFCGAAVGLIARRRARDETMKAACEERGTLFASGLVVGGSLALTGASLASALTFGREPGEGGVPPASLRDGLGIGVFLLVAWLLYAGAVGLVPQRDHEVGTDRRT